MKLISMTDFVLQQQNESYSKDQFVERVEAYANFLKEPLKLEMFVPCDDNGKVLEQPIDIYYRPDFGCQKYPQECYEEDLKTYEQSKEKVLFEGFTFKEETKDTYFLLEEGIYTHALTKLRQRTIESLVGMDNLTLTTNAIKCIFG